ncbi:Heparanase-like protein 2 [Dendrobium catenatum]|uniref:Heparanase-like protein 2 n=1 Tax=Dendrobium catenatum TaxID=906689 RepID=A0A2I0VR81_9ASPA|nr:Heparanase-like protein 2 [Dendrobium catenatum]
MRLKRRCTAGFQLDSGDLRQRLGRFCGSVGLRSGVSILLINLSKSTGFSVTVRNNLNIDLAEVSVLKQTVSWYGEKVYDGSERREEYHLSGKEGNYLSRIMLLNGNPLQLTEDGEIPELSPVLTAINSPISIAPLSIAFVVFPNFEAKACA